MTTTHLGELNVSPIGFGCMALSHVYGGTTDDSARATLGAAVDACITFLDTADVYGEPREGATAHPELGGTAQPQQSLTAQNPRGRIRTTQQAADIRTGREIGGGLHVGCGHRENTQTGRGSIDGHCPQA